MIMYQGFQEFLCCDLFNRCMILASSIAIVVKFNLKLEDNDGNLSIARTQYLHLINVNHFIYCCGNLKHG